MTRVVVIGGGPAGSAAAYWLARRGFEVTVFERAVFPRVKVCGEFISPAATAVLEAIVPARELAAAGARRVGTFTLERGDEAAEWRLPEAAWAVSRAALDTQLLEKARGEGARIEHPASVRGVRYFDDRVRVDIADGRSREADVVVHADGSGRHDPAGAVPVDSRLIGAKCHLRAGLVGEGVRIRAADGAYVGTIRVEGATATCALVARRSLLAAAGGNADSMLERLWPTYRPEWRACEWKFCGVARSGCIPPGHPRSFRIGNAAAAVDPIGGEGIGLALWAGGTLADELARSPLGTVQKRFGREYARRLATRLPACRGAAELLMREALIRALWPLTRLPSLAVGPWYRLTGKAVSTSR